MGSDGDVTMTSTEYAMCNNSMTNCQVLYSSLNYIATNIFARPVSPRLLGSSRRFKTFTLMHLSEGLVSPTRLPGECLSPAKFSRFQKRHAALVVATWVLTASGSVAFLNLPKDRSLLSLIKILNS
ncbi:hypothetical protein BDV40DRAFT_267059 [Aspergillus tamarii]|uniref:Uncharacterized protein n=1 Tax=Aspergillus tamarii TaxID=41984 RepID=A0A5N6USU7_ASPTM|nr:hypothetical protein BDV40DRAFT_267059 [Aspergillus tamarii]